MASYRFTTTPASLPSPSTPDYFVDKSNQKTRFDSDSPVDTHPQSFFDLSTSRQTSMPKVLFKIPGMGVYRTLSGILGFRESQSLALAFICGGALAGFCLYHAQMLSQSGMQRLTTPGEWYELGKSMFHTTYSIHIILSVVGGILVIPQFIPALRRRMMNIHRLNGYLVLLMLIPANICGSITANKAFGGEINAQSAYYTLGILVVGCLFMGIAYVKTDTREHRKWMIRAVNFFCVAITTRLIVLAAREIVTDIGNYHSIFRCDNIIAELPDLVALAARFPQCTSNSTSFDPSTVWVAVRANSRSGDRLEYGSCYRVAQGMGLWFALLMHALGGEAYLLATDDANYYKHDYVLEPKEDPRLNLGPYPMAI